MYLCPLYYVVKSQCKGIDVASLWSLVVDEERMRRVDDFPWLGPVLLSFRLCFDDSVDSVTGRASGL